MEKQKIVDRLESTHGGVERLARVEDAPSGEDIAAACLASMDRIMEIPEHEMDRIFSSTLIVSRATPADKIAIKIDESLQGLMVEPKIVTGGVVSDLTDNFLLLLAASTDWDSDSNWKDEVGNTCLQMVDLLLEKNISYGNSALKPIGIFSNPDEPETQIFNRLDDKFARCAYGSEFPGDNDLTDIFGYLILLQIARSVQ